MDRRVELRISGVVVLAGILWLYGATQIHVALHNELLNEASLPYAIGLILVSLGLVLTYRGYRSLRLTPQAPGRVPNRSDEPEIPASDVRPLVVVAICLAWALLLDTIGFVILTAAVMGLILWLMRFRRPASLVALSVATSAIVFLIIDVLLRVHLPGGILAPLTDSWHI